MNFIGSTSFFRARNASMTETPPSQLRLAGSTSPDFAAAHTRANILMVDDQPARLLTYEAILSGLGLNCVRALSGEEALKRLLGQEFAVILLDVNMPGMDGFEVARLVREHPRLERTPIIFVTAIHVSELDQLRGYEVGAIDYIAVPVVPEVLRSKVAILVELHQRRHELREVNRALSQAREHLVREHERALQESQAQLAAIFEHPSEAIIVLEASRDRAGEVRDWMYRNANTTALNLLGRSLKNLVGSRLIDVLTQNRADAVIEICTRVLQTGEQSRYEARYGDRDFLVTIFPMDRDRVISAAVDITDRKRAEAALRASERRYQALIEDAPVAVAHNAMDGRFQYVNKAFCQLVGYSAEELYCRTWHEITYPEDVSKDQALANDVVARTLPGYIMEKRYIRKDGLLVWVSLFGNFVFDDADNAVQGVAVAIDITERKRAERALRESEQRLTLAKQAARLGTHDYDLRSGVIEWDERTRDLWGVGADEQVTYDIFANGLHPDDRASTNAAFEKALQFPGDGRFLSTYRVVHRGTGETRWIEATGQVYFEGEEPIRLIGTVQDISQRVISEARLRESEERIREIANNIDHFAWTCDELGRVTWYNDRWYEFTGTSFADTMGEGWKSILDPAHLPRILPHLQECFSQGVPWEDTYPLRGKDGRYRWFLSRAVPIRDEQGRVRRWFGTNTDVTELRRLQDAFREADHRKDLFLAMLAHELRNPVAPITSAAEALSQVIQGQGSAEGLVGIVRRQANNLSRLLDDLLDVARITQGRIELRIEAVALETCVDLALESAQPLIGEKRHEVTFARWPETLYVNADCVRLTQCIGNLLINAAKYTDAGGKIRLRTRLEGENAVIEVSDNGQGIPSEFLPHMFELFAQSERTLDRSQGGLGIGLSVCKQLIEAQGGSVTGESPGVGHGATFTLRIPLARRVEGAAAPITSAPAVHRILVVDDNRDAADAIAMLLQFDGHDAQTVYSAEAALERLADFIPSVVLLDIGLPGMNGYELARTIRGSAIPQPALIAVTGYGQKEDKVRAAEAGFDAHLTKPVEIDALTRALADLQAGMRD